MKFNSTIVSLVCLNGLKEGFFLIIAPFLPDQMDEKEMPKAAFTPLFVSYTLWLFISSLAAGKLQGKFGRRLMIRIACFLQASAAVCFICLNYIDNVPLWLVVGFFGRTVQGMGAGLLQTSAYSELLIQFPEIQEKLVSVMETGAVIGGFIGLIVSAFLAYFVGFVGPFAFCGLVFAFFGIFMDCLITFVPMKTQPTGSFSGHRIRVGSSILQPTLHQQAHTTHHSVAGSLFKEPHHFSSHLIETNFNHQEHSLDKSDGDHHPIQSKQLYDKIGYFTVIATTRGFFACIDVLVNLETYYYNDTILADYLKATYHYEPWLISVIYSVQSIGFMITAPLAPKFVYKFSLVGVVICAQLVQACATYFVGPSEVLHIPQIIWITIGGFILSGLASPFSVIPPYKELENCLEAYPDKNFDPEEVQDIVSGLFNSSYAFGGIMGPLYGGFVNTAVGFRNTNDIQGLILIFVAVTQFFIVYIPMQMRKRKQGVEQDKKVDQPEDNIKLIATSQEDSSGMVVTERVNI